NAALAAYASARTHPSIPESAETEAILFNNGQLMKLWGIKNFSYVYPKRRRRPSDLSDDEVKLNYVVLLWEDLQILNNAERRDRYTSDGTTFQALAVAAQAFAKLFDRDNLGRIIFPADICDDLVNMMYDIEGLLKEITYEGKLID